MTSRNITTRDWYFKHIVLLQKDKTQVKYVTGSISLYKHCNMQIFLVILLYICIVFIAVHRQVCLSK
jgi:hypothetical protein